MILRLLLALVDADTDPVMAALNGEDVLVERVRGAVDLWSDLAGRSFDMLIVSRDMLPRPAADAVASVGALPGQPEVVVLVHSAFREEETRLLGAGCAAVLFVESPADALRDAFSSLLARRRGDSALRIQTDSRPLGLRLADLRSESPVMRQLLDVAERVAESDTTALMLGETGSGKEWLARAIHASGSRADAPFIAVNCGAIPDTLIESELFGHEEGAFTGARRAHRGHFEMAHTGTIFLDEVGEMPSHVQIRLLRVLQERQFQRIGSEVPINVDIRILAATNRDPAEEIAAKRLRSDLYYRLGVVTLTLPPLRDRREDIAELARHFLGVTSSRMGRRIHQISRRALDALVDYDWPGNVRELQNVVERLVLLSNSPEIDLDDLPDELLTPGVRPVLHEAGTAGTSFSFAPLFRLPLRDARRHLLDAFEREYLESVLRSCDGRVGATAERAGISQRALYTKMRRLGLSKEQFHKLDSELGE